LFKKGQLFCRFNKQAVDTEYDHGKQGHVANFCIPPLLIHFPLISLYLRVHTFGYDSHEIYQFQEDVTTITFAGTTKSYTKNTVKMGVLVQGWPFRALQHSLVITFATQSSQEAGYPLLSIFF
jgi:hypothetical protein